MRSRARTRRVKALQNKGLRSFFPGGRRLQLESLEGRRLLAVAHEHNSHATADYDVAGIETVQANQPMPRLYSQLGYRDGAFGGFLSAPKVGKPLDIGLEYVRTNAASFGLEPEDLEDYIVTSQYKSDHNGVTHIYLRQEYNGLPIINTDLNINVMADGRVLSVGSRFVPNLTDPVVPQPLQPAMNAVQVVNSFADRFDFTRTSPIDVVRNDGGQSQSKLLGRGGISLDLIPAELVYVATPQGLELSWQFEIQTLDKDNWFLVTGAADDGQPLTVANYVAHATYNVFPLPLESPADGPRQLVVDPHDPLASPFGWHDVNGIPGADFTNTRGNNVFAQDDLDGDDLTIGPGALGGPNLVFDFPLNLAGEPISYLDAATTNLFYASNIAHDILFHYGFNEASGNFQALNYSSIGLGGDPVFADAQDSSDTDNANFATPPDGVAPRMQMFLWTAFLPQRDSDLENGVIFHEYGHGLSNRLTGGPANSAALVIPQAGAMGEGWSDFVALTFTQQPGEAATTPRPIGIYLTDLNGVRDFPYSFDMGISPKTYEDYAPGAAAPHPNGEIWAATLWDLHWLLIDRYGYDPNLYTGTGGNNVALQLVVDGMKLQESNPTYVNARDAILNADVALTGGVNTDLIWQAFARRGIGYSAFDGRNVAGAVDDTQIRSGFDLPPVEGRMSGTVYRDANQNAAQDAGEVGLAGATVFIDTNQNGLLDPKERSTVSDANGNYFFTIFAPGVFQVRQVPIPGLDQTEPFNPDFYTVTLPPGGNIRDLDFGNAPADAVSGGGIWHDTNGDGVRDPGELPLADIFVFVDLDKDFRVDVNEPSAVSDINGNYSLPAPPPGTYSVTHAAPPGWTATFPVGGVHELLVKPGQKLVKLDFGFAGQLHDFGDAPSPYSVVMENDGARHGILTGFRLGALLDGEVVPANSDDAMGDNGDGAEDEDGVQFNSLLFAGAASSVTVDVRLNGQSPGRLQGFIDFNQDGDWNDPGEQIITNKKLLQGVHTLPFTVPLSVLPGTTFARFRYGFENGLGPNGPAMAGEVEDYAVLILGTNPDALDDNFSVAQDSAANSLDVLANDLPSANGPPKVTSVSATSLPGGTVQVAADGLSILYTPPRGRFGIDTFTYNVSDGSGGTDSATVTVSITPTFQDPIAIDDFFNAITGPNTLNVLANDIVGINGPLRVQSVTQPTNGTVSIAPGGLAVIYTPSVPFSDLDQFTYTLVDAANVIKTATVSVQVQAPNAAVDDVVAYSFTTTDLAGNTITAVPLGQSFQLHVFADDLRTTDPNTSTPGDDRGVFSAYLDILYDSTKVIVENVLFAPACGTCQYPNVTSADFDIPNVISDLGGTQAATQGLGPNPTKVAVVVLQAINPGTVTFQGDPTELFPAFDTLFFEPPQPVLIDQITYGTKSITIVGAGSPPRAVDDTFATGTTSLNVLANDIQGSNGAVVISAVGTPTAGGSVIIANGGTTLTYSPPAGGASNQFTYTIRDSAGLTATAVATVQGNPADDLINMRLEARTLNGTVLDGGNLPVGEKFNLNVYVDDLRATDPNPGGADDRGVFAAYLDVLYNRGLVSVDSDAVNPLGFDITCGPAYTRISDGLCNGAAGDIGTPGVVNDAGAFQVGSGPLGANEFLLFTIQMTANGIGNAVFRGDPADIRSETGADPDHDTLLFEPPQPVGISRIRYGSTSFNVIGASPEGENTNPRNPLDVNNDGRVSPVDALLGANKLNRDGAGPLDGEGEGESTSASHYYYDVNADGFHSPIDVLRVVSHLNGTRRGAGEAGGSSAVLRAEGESSALLGSTDPVSAATSQSAAGASETSSLGAALLASPSRRRSTTDPAPVATSGSIRSNRSDELPRQDRTPGQTRRPAIESEVAVSIVEDLLTDDLVSDVASAWKSQ